MVPVPLQDDPDMIRDLKWNACEPYRLPSNPCQPDDASGNKWSSVSTIVRRGEHLLLVMKQITDDLFISRGHVWDKMFHFFLFAPLAEPHPETT